MMSQTIKRYRVVLAVSFTMLAILLTGPASAAQTITELKHSVTSDGIVRIVATASEAFNTPPASFSIDSPARIVIDIAGSSGLDKKKYEIGQKGVRNVSVVEGNGRTRLVAQLDSRQQYNVTTSANSLVLEIGSPGTVAQAQAAAPVTGEVSELQPDAGPAAGRLSLNFQDIEVRAVLQLLADFTGLNLVTSDTVSGRVTLRLKNVPWDQALDIIMDARNLDKRLNGNVLWIGPTGDIAAREQQLLQAQLDRRILEPLQTVIIPVNYASAEDLRTLILDSTSNVESEYGLLSERGSVTVDARTNSLLITDTADKILEVRELVAELDYAVRQVQIESRIVIAQSDFVHELGVRFGVTALHLGSNIGILAADGSAADIINPAINPRDDGLLDIPGYPDRYQVNLPANDPNASTLGLSFLGSDVILDLELSALEADGEGEVISTPRVITANQAEAFIQQGVEIPYQQASSSGATNVQFKEAVL